MTLNASQGVRCREEENLIFQLLAVSGSLAKCRLSMTPVDDGDKTVSNGDLTKDGSALGHTQQDF